MSAAFRFVSYKVDQLALNMRPSMLMLTKPYFDEVWDIKIGMRIPQYFRKSNSYLAGLDVTMTYPPMEGEDSKEPSITVTAGVMGLFEAQEGRFPIEVEEKIVRSHLPTLVMPYLRAAVTSALANCGVGIHILPLFNLHEIASETLKDEKIIVLD